MAFLRDLPYSAAGLQAALDDALAYAGGRFAEELHTAAGTIPGTSIEGCIFLYEGPHTADLLMLFGIGGSNLRCVTGAYADPQHLFASTRTDPPSLNVRVIATKSAVAVSLLDTDGNCEDEATVVTLDSAGSFCCVTTGSNGAGFESPAVVPRTGLYTEKVVYPGVTETAFHCIALSMLPVPVFDGQARYLPDVLFAHAGQLTGDGAVLLGESRFYALGGCWYLRETGAEPALALSRQCRQPLI